MVEIIELDAKNDPAPGFLVPYIQSGTLNFLIGSGASFPAITTAGNIETEINALLAGGKESAADLKCLEFIEAIDAVHAAVVAKSSEPKIKGVVDSYSNFSSMLDRILFARKNVLLPRQATIFTTNYDIFIEHASSLLPGVMLNDGFDRTSVIGSRFVFAPERYFDRTFRSGPIYGHGAEIPTLNLIKLHGSLSWQKSIDTVVLNAVTIPKVTSAQKADSALVRKYLEKHFLILPNFRKFHTTIMERIYYDLLRLFSKAFDKENAVLLVFGFSFADEHILDVTRRGLRNPTAQLIIFSHSGNSTSDYKAKFEKHRNVTILTPKTGEHIGFARFTEILTAVIPSLDYDD